MNRLFYPFLLLVMFSCCKGRGGDTTSEYRIIEDSISLAEVDSEKIPDGVARLMSVYPEQVKGFDNGMLIMADGDSIAYDDGRRKDFVTMLDDSDPEDMFTMCYERKTEKPNYLSDAGRSRCEHLFKCMYGKTASEVESNLVEIDWFGQTIRVTKVNGCADSLKAIAREMSLYKELLPYIQHSSSFYWRRVRGAKRQSAHSYGIALDINTLYSNYWLWKYPHAKESDKIGYENRIPQKIVDVFERHGFIWGGRWYHYDTMHFEFRPELL